MSGPYGTPQGGNPGEQEPRRWGQQPDPARQGPPSGGVPARPHHPVPQPGYPPQSGYGQQPGYQQPGGGQAPYPAHQPGWGAQPGYPQQPQPGGRPYPQQGPPSSGGFPAQPQFATPYPGYPPQPGYGQPGTQQYPGPPGTGAFGQVPPGFAGTTGKPGKKKGLIVGISGAVVVAAAVVLVLGFAWPGFFTSTVLDHRAVQSGVKDILTNDYKVGTVTDVSCPPGQQVTVGHTFTCTATVDGAPKRVTITVRSETGKYEVGQPH